MKFIWLQVLFSAAALAASPPDISGTWKVVYTGPPGTGPKTVGSIVLDLKVNANAVTGMAHIGAWPGDAPIADGKIEGDHMTFTATGTRTSTTGIPTCQFEVTVHGDEMAVKMTVVRNAGGPLGPGIIYEFSGHKASE